MAMRLMVDAGVQKLSQLAQATNSTPALQAEFTALVQDTLARGTRAVQLAPDDYRGYLALGAVYDLLATLRVEGAYQSARATYDAAAERNPTSPVIPLLTARLEATQGKLAETQKSVERALTLKPNYTDAMLFVVQLAVAQNDLPTAIRAAEAAAQTAPGVASIWFQLGLLYYAGNDMGRAIPALERALVLVPDYANAKYFLGAAYYAQGRKQEGIALFEDLQRTNPDAAEVVAILENMRAGRGAFSGVQNNPPQQAPVAE